MREAPRTTPVRVSRGGALPPRATRSFGIPPASACCAMLHFAEPPAPYRLPGGVWHTLAQTKAKSTLYKASGCDFAFLLCSTPIKAKKGQVCFSVSQWVALAFGRWHSAQTAGTRAKCPRRGLPPPPPKRVISALSETHCKN